VLEEKLIKNIHSAFVVVVYTDGGASAAASTDFINVSFLYSLLNGNVKLLKVDNHKIVWMMSSSHRSFSLIIKGC
jgi:hypothetical protein